jgi:protein-L-isoaspartate O-methyltransferase
MTTSHIYTADSYEPTRENKKIYAAILQLISILKPASVLEVGSGIGMLGDAISKTGIRYVGSSRFRGVIPICSI